MAGSALKRRRIASGEELSGKDLEKQQERINRKRAQNRVSQQCIREKAQAHAKQLEALTEMIKSTTQSESQTDIASHKALMQSHLKLIEENRELKDALLRLRKKLLSLGSAANAGADDGIFDRVLRTSVSKKRSKKVEDQDIAFEPDEGGAGDCLNTGQDDGYHTTKSSPPPWVTLDDTPAYIPFTNGASVNDPSIGPIEQSDSRSVRTFPTPEPLEHTRLRSHIDRNAQEPEKPWDILPPILFPFSPSLLEKETPDLIFSDLVFEKTQKIEEACISYLSHRIGIRGLKSSRVRNEIAKYDLGPGLVTEVAKIGVELIGRIDDRSAYIYGLGANDIMEKILRWRCSPSPQNKMAIPEPFRPTTLQGLTMNHSVAIDFINWPSIRDQLIFKAGTYNLTKMISDIYLNTVIEIPRFKASINIHDTFVNRVFARTSASYAHSELDFLTSLFENYDTIQTPSTPDIPSSNQEIEERIAQEMRGYERQNEGLRSSTSSRHPYQKEQLASKWGLDNLVAWKLSREFAVAHPELDCSSVTSGFPMYSASMIPEL